MATFIKTTGEEKEVKPRNGKWFGLAELQELVGGYIEIVAAKDGRLMVINGEGKLKEAPQVNRKATEAYVYGDRDMIFGDVILCTEKEITDDNKEDITETDCESALLGDYPQDPQLNDDEN